MDIVLSLCLNDLYSCCDTGKNHVLWLWQIVSHLFFSQNMVKFKMPLKKLISDKMYLVSRIDIKQCKKAYKYYFCSVLILYKCVCVCFI